MCKWSEKKPCTVLGTPPWNSSCPLPPPAWFQDELKKFVAAYRFAASGETERSLSELLGVDSRALQDWFHIHAQNSGAWRAGMSRPTSVSQPAKRESLNKFLEQLFRRDRYQCRYCGTPVIPKNLLDRFSRAVGTNFFPTKKGNYTRHGIIMCFSATLDHVLPVRLGGATNANNLVTACRCCNYGKADFSLAELSLQDPRDREILDGPWLGLTEIIWKQPHDR